MQSDLFDQPLLEGLAQAREVISASEERDLIASIDGLELSPFRFQGWLGKRLTASFGWRYDFDTGCFGRADPISDWLLPLRRKAAEFARLTPDELVQALVIRYDSGAGIGWHRDRSVFEHVIGVSLGAPATMRFRRRRPGGFDRVSVLLRCYWSRDRSTISPARLGANGSTASPQWRRRAGRSIIAASQREISLDHPAIVAGVDSRNGISCSGGPVRDACVVRNDLGYLAITRPLLAGWNLLFVLRTRESVADSGSASVLVAPAAGNR